MTGGNTISMDDLLEDLRRFIRENPIDYTECDNYVAWGGSQKGNNYWEGCHHTEETKTDDWRQHD